MRRGEERRKKQHLVWSFEDVLLVRNYLLNTNNLNKLYFIIGTVTIDSPVIITVTFGGA